MQLLEVEENLMRLRTNEDTLSNKGNAFLLRENEYLKTQLNEFFKKTGEDNPAYLLQ